MGEFDLIRQFFQRPAVPGGAVALGVGDDCALLDLAPGMQLAVSSDMLVEGRHFLSTVDAALLGHKALAVNLSDLAACGARPLAFTLALSLPSVDAAWLAGLAQGLFALADAHGCQLMGGDTTRGPLNLCITVFGEVPRGGALLRSGARAGDDLWVSGTLGDARLALEVFRGRLSVPEAVFAAARARMEQPTPRVALGLALRGIATSAIDISDGLAGDLGHVLRASGVGAMLDADAVAGTLAARGAVALDAAMQRSLTLAGGDDYELAFTAPADRSADVEAAARSAGVPVTRIGRIEAEPGLRVVDAQGRPVDQRFASFDHFG
ncbi:thiamine-phosphate kinase [Pseudacidovorax intermedius]|uniref:thiamine-phosphate kinase n=1 Tax=Pseudacidovorax intermedius TaxID=433924 RepID=UPI0026F015D9|nr:thiamine-phosphate kinase [Pseudacidovorax intermedius]